MAHPGHPMRQKVALTFWIVACLVLFAFGGFLLLSTRSPGPQETTMNELHGIVALSSSNAWAVGWATGGQGSSPLIEHWNGAVWSRLQAPGKGTRSLLESVAARSTQDIWAVGVSYQGADEETLIEHWNGRTWQMVASPNGQGNNRLEGVAVVSATDVWAVGTTDPCPAPLAFVGHVSGNALPLARPAWQATACTDPPHPLIEHWDGRTWSLVPSPLPDPKAVQAGLSEVAAFGPADVWASGSYFDQGLTPADGAALLEQWDGTAWHIRNEATAALGGRMWATAFLSSRDLWGAEYVTSHAGTPTLKHWDGSTWNSVAGPPFGSGGYFVGAMAASASDDLWAVGNHEPPQQDGSQDQVFSMHWNGSLWRLVSCPSPAGGDITLTVSVSLGPDDAWLVGTYYPSSTTQLTFLEHWDGHVWRLVPNPNPAQPAPVGP